MRLKTMNTCSTKATEWMKFNTNIWINTLDIRLERKHTSWFWDNSYFNQPTQFFAVPGLKQVATFFKKYGSIGNVAVSKAVLILDT